MQTMILSSEQVNIAADLLKRGELVAIPTETVYGLAAPIFDPTAIQKIFSLKQRPSDNPLIAHVSSLDMVASIAKHLPEAFHLLSSAFWPGPLTFVLPKQDAVPFIATAGLETVAVRMPSHSQALKLIDRVGQPLVAPSANLSGKPSPTSVEHVLEDFSGRLAAILDGGPCSIGIESTVLSLLDEIPVLLRPGAISREQIEDILKMAIAFAGAKDHGMSPGMKYRHYAPKASVHLVESVPLSCEYNPFILSREPTGLSLHRPLNAKTLYAFLREADRISAREIWVIVDPTSFMDEALMNRLKKAAGQI